MISKRISCAPGNDNYRRLANYIAGRNLEMENSNDREYYAQPYPGETGELAQKRMRGLSERSLVYRTSGERAERDAEGILSFDARSDHQSDDLMRRDRDKPDEKCLLTWTTGCWAGDDYELAMQEIADTQALNTRTTKEKTYHLIISFRPEDQSKLTPEAFKTIEERFARALGLEEHQRLCGVHGNTENVHMHIAYNLIHPEKLTRIEPWKDFIARDRLCRELEKEYGLAPDNGRIKDRKRGIGEQAAAMEAHSGQQSFERYAQEQGAGIYTEMASAKTWEDIHTIFARHGLELAPRGAGLIVKNRHGKQRAKASAVHKEFSLKKLEASFGKFQKAPEKLPESERAYSSKPVQKNADSKKLWQEFQETKKAHKAELDAIKQKWEEYRKDLANRVIARKSRAYLLQLSRQKEAEEKQRLEMQKPGNWLEYLQKRAMAGDENALAILRSRQEEAVPDVESEQKLLEAKAETMSRKGAILESRSLKLATKRRLASQAIMEGLLPGVKTDVSSHGHLLYTLPNGERICDTGKRISFSDGARSEALAYMAAKWHVKRVERDKDEGAVFVFPDGQKMKETDQKAWERPTMKSKREQEMGNERG